jgi:hypothetical protein
MSLYRHAENVLLLGPPGVPFFIQTVEAAGKRCVLGRPHA